MKQYPKPPKGEDHPHAYGDKPRLQLMTLCVTGSSPRVWGQDSGDGVFTMWERIIPTRMGTRVCLRRVSVHKQDHPHAYGDKFAFVNTMPKIVGSSPRVWGQVLDVWNTYKNDRIIPTRMGTSVYLRLSPSNIKDHPHAYGDKIRKEGYMTYEAGSSPRVWGQD